jgi:hypothetical protein
MQNKKYCIVTLLLCASRVSASFITVYGSPTYTPGVGGFKNGALVGITNDGTAIGYAQKYDGSDTNWGVRAVRWDASGAATELGNLGTFAGGITYTYASAINTGGTAVGYADKFDGLGTDMGSRAVLWSASGTSVMELGNLGTSPTGYTESQANAINAGGTTVGYATKYDQSRTYVGTRAVRWNASNAVATELGNLGTSSNGITSAQAYAINGAGTAVGWVSKFDASGVLKGTRAVRWNASGTSATELDNLGAPGGYTDAQANAINAAGTAVGSADKYDTLGKNQGTRAVRWDPSGTAVTELGNLGTNPSGTTIASAVAINANGTTVGYAEKFNSIGIDRGRRAVRWDSSGTAATELGNLGTDINGSTSAYVYAINDADFAVGYAQVHLPDGSASTRAVYWGPDAVAVNLNTLIDPASGWTLFTANSISDTGWIAGTGSFDPDGPGGQAAYIRQFSMQIPATAVPEPSSAALLFLAVLPLLRARSPIG